MANSSPFARAMALAKNNWRLLSWAVLFLVVSGYFLQTGMAQHRAANADVTTRTTSAQATMRTTASPSPAAGAAVAHTTTQAPSIPLPLNCTPSAYIPPASVDLTSANVGLVEELSPAAQYRIYGNTAEQIEAQVRRCAPKTGEATAFAGETYYNITWQYNYSSDEAGQCKVTDAKIGLHTQIVLPFWQPSQFAASGLARVWQTFISNLNTHEQGHIALDRQYARGMLDDLQNFPATSCNNVEQLLNAKMQADMSALKQANAAYDARTNHGATQGAILP